MKRILSILLAISIAVTTSYSSIIATETDSIYSISLGEIQSMLIDYLDETGNPLQPGTEEFYSYICDQLLEHSDENLINNPNYNLIHAYMAEYKVAYDDYALCITLCEDNLDCETISTIVEENSCVTVEEGKVSFSLSDGFLSTTIGEIIDKNCSEEAIYDEAVLLATSSYSGSAAAEYATEYANSKNTSYPHYTTGDCTNFVSQCLYAGGIEMVGTNTEVGTYETTSDWYCYYIKTFITRKYAVTTSWIRVVDFSTWISTIATKSTKSTLSSLISACSVGDPVLLADKTTGTPYHAIIITKKDSSTAYFCGHTTNRNNADVNDYLDDSSDKFYLYHIS